LFVRAHARSKLQATSAGLRVRRAFCASCSASLGVDALPRRTIVPVRYIVLASLKPVSRYMSAAPVAIQQTAPLSEAIALLQEHNVRHLPVLDGQMPVGIVSERDLAMAGTLVPEAWELIPVAEAMTPEPYTVGAETPVVQVARAMAEHRYGAVLVTDDAGGLLGMFTTTDAMAVLAACGAEDAS